MAYIVERKINGNVYLYETESYYETMGGLFRAISAETLRKTLDVRLWELFIGLVKTVCQIIEIRVNEAKNEIVPFAVTVRHFRVVYFIIGIITVHFGSTVGVKRDFSPS